MPSRGVEKQLFHEANLRQLVLYLFFFFLNRITDNISRYIVYFPVAQHYMLVIRTISLPLDLPVVYTVLADRKMKCPPPLDGKGYNEPLYPIVAIHPKE